MFEKRNLHVRYECDSFDKRLMECDKLDSNSVQGLHVENFGLSSDVDSVVGKSGIEKMDWGERKKKSGSKKRSKSVEGGFNSDDDEPLGFLFKMKSKRNPKKVKVGLDGGGDKGKQVEVRAEEMVVKDEDLGGMNDTLASFRKKLRGPKKDSGSGSVAGNDLASNAAEPSCQSLDGPVKDGGLAITSTSKIVEKGQIDMSGGNVDEELESKKAKGKSKRRSKIASLLKKTGRDIEFDVVGQDKGQIDASYGTVDMEVENRSKGKTKRSKIASLLKKAAGDNEFDDVGLAAKSISKIAENGEATDDHALNETVDNEFEQRPKGKSKRSRSVSLLEKTGGGVEFDDALDVQGSADNSSHIEKECNLRSGGGSNHCLDDNLEDSLSSFFRKAQSGLIRKSRSSSKSKELKRTRPGSEVVTIITGSDDSLHLASGKVSIDSTCDQNKDEIHQNPGTQGNFSVGDPKQGLSSARIVKDEISRPSDSILGRSSKSNLEDSFPISLHQSSQSSLMECSNKMPGPQEGELDWQTSGIQERRTLVTPGSNHFLDGSGEEYICVKVEDSGFFPSQEPTSGIQNVKEENDSSTGKASDLVHDDIEMSNLISAAEHMPCENLEPSAPPSQKPLACNEKTSVPLEPADRLEVDHCVEDQPHTQFHSSSSVCNKSHRIPSACVQDPDIASISSEKEDASASGSGLSPVSSNRFQKYKISFRANHLQKSVETDDNPNPSSQNLPVNYSGDDGASSPSTTPDHNGSYAGDTVSVLEPESKDMKLSAGQRVVRKPKKYRHGDMAYEGDADWEILIHEQDFLVSHRVGDEGQSIKTNKKLNFSSTMASGAENGGAAAISSGLKARAVGPVEKIKFKEVLKRKGGLQEYLEYRNRILGLWSKDVSRILPLSECGVSDTPLADEPQCASLVRDIYAFLDHCGYINFGVASEKEIAEAGAEHKLELLEEKKSGVPVTDSDDGVSFILGTVKHLETSMEEKNDSILDNENTVKYLRALELSSPTVPKGYAADCDEEKGLIDAKPSNKNLDLSILSSNSFTEVPNGGAAPVTCEELQKESHCNKPGNHRMNCDSEVRKRVIVIGAGPAGLTAARHLQRQGFQVTVLEARSRIGGRVFTDRSSLSVPVDLGASIITGVEADVATERRPDPSSLVCAQLGLELTVLNSDCPLYDIVTGEKVPPTLDESLEEEYNSLLDDTLVLVAQKGEHAMRMSLEDGLEYALKRRRTVRSEKILDDNGSTEEILSPLERRVMDWHFANLEYGCAALLKEVSLPYWNQDDVYGGFGGAHCMIKGGYSNVVESLGEGLCIHLNHVVTDVSYCSKDRGTNDDHSNKVRVSTSNGRDFSGDAVLITVPLGCLKAESIKFSPSLPQWKYSSIQRLGFGVLNKVVLEFPEVFWDDSVDYFGATAEETNKRGQCFMFWNVKKTVGAPVLIALVVGKAAIDGQNMNSSDHVNHAVTVLRKLFGETKVHDPVASVVTDWGRDPYSYGAYSYVSVGATGEDYDILGRPVENCLFFAGEATCKEHPDTVGGAMMSGLREAVRIIDILSTGNDYTAEVDAMEAAQRHSYGERSEVGDIIKRLETVELSNDLYNNSSFDRAEFFTREGLLRDMFSNAKTAAGRLHLVKELLNLPVEALKSFAGTKEGLTTLNSWILDSLGKDGTQLLRHCVRLLVLVSTDLLAVRLSGIGKTVKEKVCVHTSRDIRAIASQLVSVWIEVFRKEKATNGGLKLLRQSTALDSSKSKYNLASGKPPLRTHQGAPDKKGSSKVASGQPNINIRKVKPVKLDTRTDSKSEVKPSMSQGSVGRQDSKGEEDKDFAMSEEEKAALAAAEAARAAELAAAEAYASSGARCNTSLQLPKIPSFHKFARREQYAQMDEADVKKKWSAGVSGRQDCISEIDSRNCRVRDWSVDFSAAGVNLDSSKMSVDNRSPRSHSNEIASQLNFREHSGESVAVDSGIFTKAWVDSAGSEGIKDYSAIERWQSQAAAADSDFFHRTMHLRDEEESNMDSDPPTTWKRHNESSASQVMTNRELINSQPRGPEHIKQAVVDYVTSLLMPLYKARKIDKDSYKSIMKKTATKVVEQTTDAEKVMAIFEFLDFKRKNKIRAFVDKLIERHMATKPAAKS